LDRRIDFPAIGMVPLAVLVEGDVQVCRLLVSVVLGKLGSTPAHHARVLYSPDTGADVAGITEDKVQLVLAVLDLERCA